MKFVTSVHVCQHWLTEKSLDLDNCAHMNWKKFLPWHILRLTIQSLMAPVDNYSNFISSLMARDKHMQVLHTAQKSQRIFRKWKQDKCSKQYRNKCFTVRHHEVLLGLILTSEVLKQLGHGGKWNGKHWRTRQNEQGEVLDNIACFKCLTNKEVYSQMHWGN